MAKTGGWRRWRKKDKDKDNDNDNDDDDDDDDKHKDDKDQDDGRWDYKILTVWRGLDAGGGEVDKMHY